MPDENKKRKESQRKGYETLLPHVIPIHKVERYHHHRQSLISLGTHGRNSARPTASTRISSPVVLLCSFPPSSFFFSFFFCLSFWFVLFSVDVSKSPDRKESRRAAPHHLLYLFDNFEAQRRQQQPHSPTTLTAIAFGCVCIKGGEFKIGSSALGSGMMTALARSGGAEKRDERSISFHFAGPLLLFLRRRFPPENEKSAYRRGRSRRAVSDRLCATLTFIFLLLLFFIYFFFPFSLDLFSPTLSL